MEVVRKLGQIRASAPCSLALGAFDGLHRGHMAVIKAALERALEAEPAVLTFESSPSGGAGVLTLGDKERLLKEAGIHRVYSLKFPEVQNWEARRFAQEILFEGCRARRLCCGEDFRFGRGAAGDVALLKELCEKAGACLTVVPPVKEQGKKISSTWIRAAVEKGDIPLANRLLGRPFGFSLTVIHGNHIGTGLGCPTINQALPEGFVLPQFGVYASWAQVEGDYFYGVTNIGVKPTVGSDRVLAETWLPGFSGDLYGRRVRLFLLKFIRPEKKFRSLEELKDEIARNALQAKAIAQGAPPPCFGLEGRPDL